MFCIHCGAECPDQAQFCTNCGQKTACTNKAETRETSQNVSAEPQKAGQTANVLFWWHRILGFFLPVVGLILYLLWRKQMPRKAKSVGKSAIFGAITLAALSVVTIFLFVMSKKGDGVEEMQRGTLPSNMFSTIADMSEIKLYLTKTYGQDILQKCNYYEFFTADNHYILAEVKNVPGLETEDDGMPKYELFGYSDSGEHIPLFKCQHDYVKTVKTVHSEKENATIYKLTFSGIGAIAEMYSQFYGTEYEMEKMYIVIADGNLEKIVFNNGFSDNSILLQYQYNQDGSVSNWIMDDCTNNKLDDEFDINSIIWKEDNEPLGEDRRTAELFYNKDGTLAKVSLNSSGEKEYSEQYQFEYENGLRSCITIDDNSQKEKQIQYTRDKQGLVKTADVSWNDSNRQFQIDYYNFYDQDTITISSNLDSYLDPDAEGISASEFIFISAQKLSVSNGGSSIDGGMENVAYDAEDVLLDGTYIKSATAQIRQTLTSGKEEYVLSVKFNDEGAKIFQEITGDLAIEQQQLCVLYGNNVISAPRVVSEITDGEAVISGLQSLKEAEEIAAVLSKRKEGNRYGCSV